MKQYLWTFIFVLLGATVATAYTYKYAFYTSSGSVWQLWSSKVAQSSWTTPVVINNPLYTAAASSAVAAANAKNALHVYYQDIYGNIVTQAAPNGQTWNNGQIIVYNTTALAGTALAAVCYPDSTDNQLFFQDVNGNIRQIYSTSSGWTLSTTFSYKAQVQTPITAAAWSDNQIRVYFLGSNGNIYQLDWGGSSWALASVLSGANFLQLGCYYPFKTGGIDVFFVDSVVQSDLNTLVWSSGGWTTGTVYTLVTIPGGISALYDNSTYSYVYFQNSAYTIQELYLDSGSYFIGSTMSVSVGAPTFIASTLM